jgi:hypothetical protein
VRERVTAGARQHSVGKSRRDARRISQAASERFRLEAPIDDVALSLTIDSKLLSDLG